MNLLTRLVLTNAVYFKGNWVKEFDKSKTTDEDFWLNDKEKVKVPMMKKTGKDAKFKYGEDDLVQILEMSYEGEKNFNVDFATKK